ncbi:transcription factor, partial [Reticulomyxa filosa]
NNNNNNNNNDNDNDKGMLFGGNHCYSNRQGHFNSDDKSAYRSHTHIQPMDDSDPATEELSITDSEERSQQPHIQASSQLQQPCNDTRFSHFQCDNPHSNTCVQNSPPPPILSINHPFDCILKETSQQHKTQMPGSMNRDTCARHQEGGNDPHNITCASPFSSTEQGSRFSFQKTCSFSFEEGIQKPVELLKESLRVNELLFNADDEQKERTLFKLVQSMTPLQLQTNEVLMTQGEISQAFYWIERGRFAVFVQEDNKERKIGVAGPKETVGEITLMYHTPQVATLKALEPSRVWSLKAADLDDIRRNTAQWNVDRFVQRQKFLRNIPLFSTLEEHELLNLTHACFTQMYEHQQEIFGRDVVCDDVFIVQLV